MEGDVDDDNHDQTFRQSISRPASRSVSQLLSRSVCQSVSQSVSIFSNDEFLANRNNHNLDTFGVTPKRHTARELTDRHKD